MNKVHLIDNMEFMKGIPDKYYELAIVDPPYGIGEDGGCKHRLTKTSEARGFIKSNEKIYENKDWDIKPSQEYFKELFRISQNQIIWGANYFTNMLQPSMGWVFWYKKGADKSKFSDGELAYTSFNRALRMFKYDWIGFGTINSGENRIHPTQKPVSLYKWLLKNYAKPNDKIFDSHVGSGSIRIACHDMGFDFEGCEIDKDYWEAQEERFNTHISQLDLMTPEFLFGGEV